MPTRLVEDNKGSSDTFGYGDDAKSTTTSPVGRAADHFIHFVLGRIDCTRETVATGSITLDFHTPLGHFVSERRRIFEIYRVPAKLDESLSAFVGVGSCNVRRPIANRTVFAAPNTGLFASISRWIDVVTTRSLVCPNEGPLGRHSLSCSAAPIVCSRNSEFGPAIHMGRDEHSFVSWQHSLTECD